MDAKTEGDMLDLGLRALWDVAGVRPEGYRAPMWEMNYHTPAPARRAGFRYDSSLMDSDHPYLLAVDAQRPQEMRPAWPRWPRCPCPGASTTGSSTPTCPA